jgi:uncharacterized membrane protein YdjX (TVP38/TMEM64 family)
LEYYLFKKFVGKEGIFMAKKWVIVTIIASLVLALFALNQFVFKVSPMSLRDWVLSFGLVAPFIYICLNVIRPFTLFPISVLSLAGGLAFGALWGTVYTVLSATFGAVLSFYLAKHLGVRWLKKKTASADKIEMLQDKLKGKGFYYVLILRIIPVINFDLVSYLAGVSRLKLRTYIVATLLGVLPGTLAYNLLGNSFVKGNGEVIAIVSGLVLLIMCIPFFIKTKPLLMETLENQKEDNA